MAAVVFLTEPATQTRSCPPASAATGTPPRSCLRLSASAVAVAVAVAAVVVLVVVVSAVAADAPVAEEAYRSLRRSRVRYTTARPVQGHCCCCCCCCCCVRVWWR